MQQIEQQAEQTTELAAWEAPELVKADVSTATQLSAVPIGVDGGIFS